MERIKLPQCGIVTVMEESKSFLNKKSSVLFFQFYWDFVSNDFT